MTKTPKGNKTKGNNTKGNHTKGNKTKGNHTKGNKTKGNKTKGNNSLSKKPKKPVKPSLNRIPMIAVLAAPHTKGNTREASISGELVYWITSGGGVPVPVQHWSSDKELDLILAKTNGIVIQGSGLDIDLKRDYEVTVANIIKKVKALNTNKTHYPLFAVGSGMELLSAIEGKNHKIGTKFEGLNNTMSKLYFTASPIAKKFKLFALFDRKDYKSFMKRPTNSFNTQNAVEYGAFKKNALLNKDYIVTSYGKDKKKQKFVATIESNKFPIFGVLFHPERVAFSRVPQDNLQYTQNAFSVSQRFLNVLVQEGRKSPFNVKILDIYKTNGINVHTTLPTTMVDGRKAYVYKNTNPAVKTPTTITVGKKDVNGVKAPKKAFL
jgi:gamma-glutamyl-gamma-aminobutyrate hydrolase PuuD